MRYYCLLACLADTCSPALLLQKLVKTRSQRGATSVSLALMIAALVIIAVITRQPD
jgi:hypothetical protein